MNIKNLTQSQKKSIESYKRMGLNIDLIGVDRVKITQERLLNGYMLNQKQLIERAKEVFPDKKTIPVVYSLDVSDITIEWIKDKMEEFGVKRKDLIKQLAIDKSSLSLYFSGRRKMDKSQLAAFYYYFLTYELNRDFREHLTRE